MTNPNPPKEEYDESAIRRVREQLAQEPTDGIDDSRPASSKGSGPERRGTTLGGRYKLLENIGEGGMGSVWVAEQQQPVKRRVAIKLIKAGMDSKQVLARFEAERQALAVMDHPNIAKVFDGGMTDQGRPYFVMEYVKGVPFTEYCDKAKLSLKDRLNLFVPVCQAVQHAHHKGIVHRDLKPSNILICLYDGHPVPKVIDFGLAKAMHQALTDRSIYTGHGMMIGTPMYMSPEQAELNNLDIDTRTDVYSLGVVLYEVLVGTTPLERMQLQQAAYDEVLRLIKEVDPPRPSIRLSGSASLPSIAAQRSIDPRELRRSLAGELDWIVMKSLEKERSRRYETATALAHDIQRYLNEEAVEACPPSKLYLLSKFYRKNRGSVIAFATLATSLFVGLLGTSMMYIRANRAEQAAIKERDDKHAALEQKSQALLKESAAIAELQESNTKLEVAFVQRIIDQIGLTDEPSDVELSKLRQWQGIPSDELKMKLFEECFSSQQVSCRTGRRVEHIVHSAIGTASARRTQAVTLLTSIQKDKSHAIETQIAALWYSIQLGDEELPAFERLVVHHLKNRTFDLKLGDALRFASESGSKKQQVRISEGLQFALRNIDASLVEVDDIFAIIGFHRCVDNRLPIPLLDSVLSRLPQLLNDSRSKDLVSTITNQLTMCSNEQVQGIVERYIHVLAPEHDGLDAQSSACAGLITIVDKLKFSQQDSICKAAAAMILRALPDEYRRTLPTKDAILSAMDLLVTTARISGSEAVAAHSWRVLDKIVATWSEMDFHSDHFGELLNVFVLVEKIGNFTDEMLAPKISQVIVEADENHRSALIKVFGRDSRLRQFLASEQVDEFWRFSLIALGDSMDSLFGKEPEFEIYTWQADVFTDEQIATYIDTALVSINEAVEPKRLFAALLATKILAPRLKNETANKALPLIVMMLQRTEKWEVSYACCEALKAILPRLDHEGVRNIFKEAVSMLDDTSPYYKINGSLEIISLLGPLLSDEEVEIALSNIDNGFQENVNGVEFSKLLSAFVSLSRSNASKKRAFDHVFGVLRAAIDDPQIRTHNAFGNHINDTLDAVRRLAESVDPELQPAMLDRFLHLLEDYVQAIEKQPKASSDGCVFVENVALQAVYVFFNNVDGSRLYDSFQSFTRIADKLNEGYSSKLIEKSFLVVLKRLPHEKLRSILNPLEPGSKLIVGSEKLTALVRANLQDLLDGIPSIDSASIYVVIANRVASGDLYLPCHEAIVFLTKEDLDKDRVFLKRFAEQRIRDIDQNWTTVGNLALFREQTLDYCQVVDDATLLARRLGHPDCIGDAQEMILDRLSDLLFHDGQDVIFRPNVVDERSEGFQFDCSSLDSPRRFRSVYMLSAWIAQNWPDFDLEATHPVTWRP
jgi:serine/threonine protein kinase